MVRRLKCTTITMARSFLLVWVVTLAAAASTSAQEWTRFRGPNGSGLSPAVVRAAWSEKEVRWKVRLAGAGPSGARTQGGRIAALFGGPRTPNRDVSAAARRAGRFADPS